MLSEQWTCRSGIKEQNQDGQELQDENIKGHDNSHSKESGSLEYPELENPEFE